MADAKMKVSQMGAVLAMDDDDLINVVTYNDQSQTYVSGKATGAKVKEYIIGTGDISALGDGTPTGAILELEQESETADSNIAETMAENGAHNLLPNTATSQVNNEVTFTVNDNYTVTVTVGSTVAADRTLSCYYATSNNHFVAGKKYKISGGANANIFVTVFIDGAIYGSSQGNVVEFTMPTVTSYMQVVVYVASGTTAQTVTVKPMITLASDPITVYAPHAMTNRELTVHTVKDNFCQFAYNDNVCIGTLFVNNLNISTAGDWAEFYTIPSNVPKPKYGVTCPAVTYPYATDATNSAICEISTTGSCKIYLETSSKRPVSQVTASFMYLI